MNAYDGTFFLLSQMNDCVACRYRPAEKRIPCGTKTTIEPAARRGFSVPSAVHLHEVAVSVFELERQRRVRNYHREDVIAYLVSAEGLARRLMCRKLQAVSHGRCVMQIGLAFEDFSDELLTFACYIFHDIHIKPVITVGNCRILAKHPSKSNISRCGSIRAMGDCTTSIPLV